MEGIKFEDPPTPRLTRQRRRTHASVVDELSRRPGEWALVKRAETRNRGYGFAVGLRAAARAVGLELDVEHHEGRGGKSKVYARIRT